MLDAKKVEPELNYFREEDVLHLLISDEAEASSIEINPDITTELNEVGELIGFEILNASTYIRNSILETVDRKSVV